MNPSLTPNRRAWQRFRAHRLAMIGLGFLAAVVAAVVVGPALSPWSPSALSDAQLQAPSAAHWFGTDIHGRDLFVRVLHGGRISLLVGAVGALVSLVIGVTWGATAGYLGGRADAFLMRTVDVLYTLPSIVFVIVLLAALEDLLKTNLTRGAGPAAIAQLRLVFMFVGLGAVSWLTMARIVRGQVLSLRAQPFVEAARALGATHPRILRRHILPNLSGVVITYLALTIPAIILYESFLSFLGLGVQPPQASLGTLLAEGAAQLNPIRTYWWTVILPGGVLSGALLALNYVADGLRDAFDPRATG